MRDCRDCKFEDYGPNNAKCYVCARTGSAAIRFEPKEPKLIGGEQE